MIYKLGQANPFTNMTTTIIRFNDNGTHTGIPMVEDNTDYQAYLKWVAEGNQPIPADEGTQ